jgi:thiol-disulfide isomerase/thioredoxin
MSMALRRAILLSGIAAALVMGTAGCGSVGSSLTVGFAAPEFKVHPALEPIKTVSIGDMKGKVVLLDFWATWCGPCRQMMPHIQSIYEHYKDKGVEVMAITEESSAKASGFATDNKYDFPFYTDESKDANTACGVIGLPTTAVIGKDGKIVYATMGMDANTSTEIEDAIKTALK